LFPWQYLPSADERYSLHQEIRCYEIRGCAILMEKFALDMNQLASAESISWRFTFSHVRLYLPNGIIL
jgi:hypothetical protein